MLVLSRKKNERIIIHKRALVTIIDIRGDRCRVGIDAPKSWSVHRQEVADQAPEIDEPDMLCPKCKKIDLKEEKKNISLCVNQQEITINATAFICTECGFTLVSAEDLPKKS